VGAWACGTSTPPSQVHSPIIPTSNMARQPGAPLKMRKRLSPFLAFALSCSLPRRLPRRRYPKLGPYLLPLLERSSSCFSPPVVPLCHLSLPHTGRELELDGDTANVTSCAWSPDGTRLATTAAAFNGVGGRAAQVALVLSSTSLCASVLIDSVPVYPYTPAVSIPGPMNGDSYLRQLVPCQAVCL